MELLWNRKGVENTFSWDTVKFLPWLKLLPLQIPGWVCDRERQKRSRRKFFGRIQGRFWHRHDGASPHTPNQVKIRGKSEYSFDAGRIRISDTKLLSWHRDFFHKLKLNFLSNRATNIMTTMLKCWQNIGCHGIIIFRGAPLTLVWEVQHLYYARMYMRGWKWKVRIH